MLSVIEIQVILSSGNNGNGNFVKYAKIKVGERLRKA